MASVQIWSLIAGGGERQTVRARPLGCAHLGILLRRQQWRMARQSCGLCPPHRFALVVYTIRAHAVCRAALQASKYSRVQSMLEAVLIADLPAGVAGLCECSGPVSIWVTPWLMQSSCWMQLEMAWCQWLKLDLMQAFLSRSGPRILPKGSSAHMWLRSGQQTTT